MKKLCLFLSFVLLISLAPFFSSCKSEKSKSSYEINAILNDNLLEAEEKVTFVNNTESTLNEVCFNLYANAYRKGAKYPAVPKEQVYSHYYDGESFGEININSVCVEKQEADFSILGEDKNFLVVKLEEEIFPEESVSIVINFSVTLAKVISRLGITEHTINLANFYPILSVANSQGFFECNYYAYGDPFYSEVASYNVNFTCEEQYNLAFSGSLINRTTKNNLATYKLKGENIRSFALVLSTEFESIKKNVNGLEISYYFYKDDNPLNVISAGEKAVTYFSNTFGEYPFKTLTIVQTPFIEGGMEFSSLVYVSDDLTEEEKIEVTVHETAHQWWQAGVGNNEILHPFLDEGLCEYSVVLFYENHLEYGQSRESLIKEADSRYRLYCSVYKEVFGDADTSMLRPLGKYLGQYEYVSIAYVKACLMFDTLRDIIKDADFFNCLKDYYKEFKFRISTPDDLIAVFTRRFKEAEGFFYGFYSGKSIL